MELVELEGRYRHLMSMPLSQLSQYSENEMSGILFEESAIKVLLIRPINQPESITIEVEFQTCPFFEGISDTDGIVLLDTMLSSFQYLKQLLHDGFQLEIIENSCIWSLWKKYNESLDNSQLQLLLYPQ